VTFSLVACDPETGDLGVAVASACLAVGAGVAWARAGVGAVATQAATNEGYGPASLELLAGGLSPAEVVRRVTAADSGAAHRQLGVVDARGQTAAFSGGACDAWAGDAAGRHLACQGNLLASPGTLSALARGFRGASGDLAARLLAALAAGEAAGPRRRGAQSAAVLVVRAGAGDYGLSDRHVDLRVDDHPQPLTELARLLNLWRALRALPPLPPLDLRPDPEARRSG
jgi:uncharacterized Ntn-hydrolase superfamily protein